MELFLKIIVGLLIFIALVVLFIWQAVRRWMREQDEYMKPEREEQKKL